MWFESNNYLYGITKNPYNLSRYKNIKFRFIKWLINKTFILKRIVGGSSGGEGCLISAAGSLIGIGSDIGGSIRMVRYKFKIFLSFQYDLNNK